MKIADLLSFYADPDKDAAFSKRFESGFRGSKCLEKLVKSTCKSSFFKAIEEYSCDR
jgi:hypothetical protein